MIFLGKKPKLKKLRQIKKQPAKHKTSHGGNNKFDWKFSEVPEGEWILKRGNMSSACRLVFSGSETLFVGSFITFTTRQCHSLNCLSNFLSVQPPTFTEVQAAVLSLSAFNLSAFSERSIGISAVLMFRHTCSSQ